MSGIDARIVKRLPAIRDTPAFELNANIKIPNGVSVFLGPSGAGKTLLFDCLGGFVRPDEGRILVEDELYYDAATGVHVPPERRRCGYIFQEHALFPHMTVRENLQFAASLVQSKARRSLNRRRLINELLESFDLSDLGERRPPQLSGGEKQRAALARILVTEPRVLLLDEPSRALDARLRRAFWELLRSVGERLKVPVLLITHDVEECFELADFVAVVKSGALLQMGTRAEVFTKPATVEVARLLDVYDIAPAEVESLDPSENSSTLRAFGQEVNGPYLPGRLIGDKGFLCVRRSEIKVLATATQGMKNERSVRNQLCLRVHGWRPSAHGIRIQLENDFSVEVSESAFREYRDSDRLVLQIPQSAVAFTGK